MFLMPAREIGRQICQRNRREPLKQQCFCVVECIVKCCVNDLFYEACRVFESVPHSKYRRLAKRLMQLAQADGRQIGLDVPAASVAPHCRNQSRLAKHSHGPTHNDRMCAQTHGQGIRCHRLFAPCHMQQRM